MNNETFDIWFTEDGYALSGNNEWVIKLQKRPIANLFEYLRCTDRINDLSLDFLILFAKDFLKKVQSMDILYLETKTKIELEEEYKNRIISSIPLSPGSEYINEDWIESMWLKMESWCYRTLGEFKGSIESCLSSYLPSFNIADRAYFHLVETDSREYPFGFLTSYTTKVNNQIKHMPLSYALEEYKDNEKELLHLLSMIFKASNKCDTLSNIIEEGQIFEPTYLTSDEAYDLLKNSDFFGECGIGFRFPTWWKRRNQTHIKANIGENLNSEFGMKSLLSVKLNFVIDNETLSKEELEELLNMQEGLVKFKNKWIEINHKKLQILLDKYQEFIENTGNEITFNDYLKMQRDEKEDENSNYLIFEHGQWLESFSSHKVVKEQTLELSNNFHGKLRNYQETGVNWLYSMLRGGFGTCLADDMGLGKTIQILAILQTMFEKNYLTNTLLIVPSSLIGNWSNEKDKFTPNLPLFVLNQTEKKLQEMDFDQPGLYITTYKLASLRESINQKHWDLVILDEAQAIKNPNTKRSKIIKGIETDKRIAMTGTPIENSLVDLWSLFDFINPGLLGSQKEFGNIIKKTSENPNIYRSLRNITQPFIMRRLKTDRSIITDLPKKIETDMYIPLSTKQITLYRRLIKSVTEKLDNKDSDAISTKGLVLSTILKSKQICNHPSQFLKSEEFKEVDSGKFLALKQLVEIIKEKHERMLVFTQYRTMINPLTDYLKSLFGYDGLSIDGSISTEERSRRVDMFNSDTYHPFMVITIKSGGTGLNLTRANHVVHFDRWWNPSVENQATDRAFRIGQKKVVNVYKFTCKGTIEDKINDIINSKKSLSTAVIGQSEQSALSMITQLDTEKLKEFFSYSGDE
ncbi:MAG: SNF2-related protein [Sphaerochaeta sp.]